MAKWAKGQSGNPNGRPKGSKNKLVTDFINALAEDFQEHGEDAIRAMRENDPGSYVKAVVQLVPKDYRFEHTLIDALAEMSDEDLASKLQEAERERIAAMTDSAFEDHIERLYQHRSGQITSTASGQSKAGLH